MNLLNIFRRKIYWVQDMIKGSKVRKHYDEIKFIYENYNSARAIEIREKNLDNILTHAVKTVPFYSQYNGLKSLEEFPVINKNIIKNNYDNFISNKEDQAKLFFVTTSGSTGTPFKSYQNQHKRNRHTADNIYFNDLAFTKIGSRLYYFRIWNQLNKKSFVKTILQNVLMLDAGKFDESFVNDLIKKLEKDNQTKSMLAYASTYEALVTTIEKLYNSPLKVQLNAIITMSEALPEHTKERLQFYFGCPVISRYSNMENGFIAQQCIENNNEYHINHASFKIEILNFENDKPVIIGEPGRIVVTDLFNYSMPFIRYDTGDIGVMSNAASCKMNMPVLKKVMGRKVDFIYTVDGTILSPHVITNTMWKFADIQQFQFIQKTKDNYLMKLTLGKNQNSNIELEMTNELISFLGQNAVINYEYIDEIPLLSSGKRRKVVNEYYK